MTDALYRRIKSSFSVGHAEVWRVCKSLRTDLIRAHVLNAAPLDPYFEVLGCIQDAMRPCASNEATIEGDWNPAVQNAVDYVHLAKPTCADREQIYARDFLVAKAARALRSDGFAVTLSPGYLALDSQAETALLTTIENLIEMMGGVNVARRIFKAIAPCYDATQKRYHLVPHPSMVGGGQPEVPWGYLIQLAAKHACGCKPFINTDEKWNRLCYLARAYAAIIDVQPYIPSFWRQMNAAALVPYLQEIAVYDTLFRFQQIRPNDVLKIANGILAWMDTAAPTHDGWSVSQALEVISFILSPVNDVRGPIFVDSVDVCRACPSIPREVVTKILRHVLSHPLTGANKDFSRPMQQPIPECPAVKHGAPDFSHRPLLQVQGRSVVLDRSICAPACLEALLSALRVQVTRFDERIGPAIESFLAGEFSSHGIPTYRGDYSSGDEHGECDLVVEAPDTVIFFEVKKKALTRAAQAGSDVHLLLDLAESLLAAQTQAGWHEVRLRRDGYLTLGCDGHVARLALDGRGVERVAVSLLEFGGFHDRILLKQFLEATLSAKFTPVNGVLASKFDKMNSMLVDIRQQISILHQSEKIVAQPFFSCWFISVPQILILLEGVTDAAGFKAELWTCRHIVTGSSDLYYDLSRTRRLRSEATAGGTK
ncbi:MAG TPA: hypothetical protein VF292_11010 [Rhodanobacteraceae bacterium]